MGLTTKTAGLSLAAALGLAGVCQAEPNAMTFSAAIYADVKDAPLSGPEGVDCTDSGAIVVADTGNGRLVQYTLKEGIATGGTEIKLSQLTQPVRVQIDSKGNVLALDRRTRRIVQVDEKGGFGGYFDTSGARGGGPSIIAGAFKVDRADNVYVLDLAVSRIVVFDRAGTFLSQIELPRGGAVFTDFCVDANGGIYGVDAVTATVFFAGKGAAAFKALSQSLKEFISFPGYITLNQGTLFVMDQNGGGLALVGLDGSFKGRRLSAGRTAGLVYYPAQLCMNAKGEALIADRGNNRVQLYSVAR